MKADLLVVNQCVFVGGCITFVKYCSVFSRADVCTIFQASDSSSTHFKTTKFALQKLADLKLGNQSITARCLNGYQSDFIFIAAVHFKLVFLHSLFVMQLLAYRDVFLVSLLISAYSELECK